jgi:hypothetical protein
VEKVVGSMSIKCARCGKNETGWSHEERNLLCDVCLGITKRPELAPGESFNEITNMSVSRYFCPKCRAEPGRLCTVGVGKWTKAAWVHALRRRLANKATPLEAQVIQRLFEEADRDLSKYAAAWTALQEMVKT